MTDFNWDWIPPPPEFADNCDVESQQQQQPSIRVNSCELDDFIAGISGSRRQSVASKSAASPVGEDREFNEKYFCDVSRDEAAQTLRRLQMEGAFIVRPGRSARYCITFQHNGDIKHVQIQTNIAGQFYLGDTKDQVIFDTMGELMNHLTKHMIQAVNGLAFRLTFNAKSATCPSISNKRGSVTSFTSDGGGGGGGGGGVQRRQSLAMSSSSLSGSGGEYAKFRPLKDQLYFFDVKRDEVDNFLLSRRVEGLFVVRPSRASPYCLSVYHSGRIVHLKIVSVGKKFALEQEISKGVDYYSVPDLVDSLTHKQRTLTLMNGECVRLKPVDSEASDTFR